MVSILGWTILMIFTIVSALWLHWGVAIIAIGIVVSASYIRSNSRSLVTGGKISLVFRLLNAVMFWPSILLRKPVKKHGSKIQYQYERNGMNISGSGDFGEIMSLAEVKRRIGANKAVEVTKFD